jgi:hypothetical protein
MTTSINVNRPTSLADESVSSDAVGVALCFKVSFGFRQWFKLQALRRNLTMTEFLITAVQSYAQSGDEVSGSHSTGTDLRK